jgi:hypothetical protein
MTYAAAALSKFSTLESKSWAAKVSLLRQAVLQDRMMTMRIISGTTLIEELTWMPIVAFENVDRLPSARSRGKQTRIHWNYGRGP